jgi:hypothetical protein
MKSGRFIIIGIFAWIVMSFSNTLWLYQIHGRLIAAGIIGLSSILWLASKENRALLKTTIFSKSSSEINGEKLLKTIQIGSFVIFSFIIITLEISRVFVRQSEGYDFITSEVAKDKAVIDQIGRVKYIAIGNQLSAGLSFKKSEKRLEANLIVFGSMGQLNINVQATNTDNWKIVELRINN